MNTSIHTPFTAHEAYLVCGKTGKCESPGWHGSGLGHVPKLRPKPVEPACMCSLVPSLHCPLSAAMRVSLCIALPHTPLRGLTFHVFAASRPSPRLRAREHFTPNPVIHDLFGPRLGWNGWKGRRRVRVRRARRAEVELNGTFSAGHRMPWAGGRAGAGKGEV